jgi:predicted dithiol-disulfide oxidoreductase (DUF899 family)
MTDHKVASRDEWLAAREALLAREKEHTRMADELARQRRELPWVRVEKEYRFETDEGTRTLAELFDGRSQLLVYHFMFGPSYEAGCPTCSSSADAVNGVVPHLNARDVTIVYVSRAPLEKLRAYKRRMGWSFLWVSSADSDFNFDFGMSRTEEQTREGIKPMIEAGMPPVVDHLASASGTDVVGTYPRPRASALSSSTRLPCITSTPPRPVGWNFLWGITQSSIVPPRVATNRTRPNSGFAGTTSTSRGRPPPKQDWESASSGVAS